MLAFEERGKAESPRKTFGCKVERQQRTNPSFTRSPESNPGLDSVGNCSMESAKPTASVMPDN